MLDIALDAQYFLIFGRHFLCTQDMISYFFGKVNIKSEIYFDKKGFLAVLFENVRLARNMRGIFVDFSARIW